ncbi:MAG TPA: aldo/keto reductase [Acidimicrobiales bacterium]|nr:aldo/keto reductase [Acidimicrobiales bacterium]
MTAADSVPEHRPLGSSGLVVSRVGLGCNNFGRRIGLDDARAVVDATLDEGITLFDTSDSYGESEEILGELLGGRRDQVLLATKFGSDLQGANGPDWGARGSRRYIRRAVERSLRRLRTDWIDLYQLHFPDPVTPMDETLAALTELVHEGKVRYIGSSNLSAWQVSDAEWLSRAHGHERFVSAQNHYSLLDRQVEAELVPACLAYGIGILPYFPLASGLLTGKYHRGEPAPEGTRLAGARFAGQMTDERFDVVEALEAFAAERSISLLDVAIGGLAVQPAVGSVIAGATRPDQVKANVAAGRWVPTPEDVAALDAIAPTPRG